MRKSMIDLTGQRHHRFVVVALTDERNSRNELKWLCRCDCGNKFKTAGRNIRSGDTQSCGCKLIETRTKHGLWVEFRNEYRIWQDIISRCRPSDDGGDPNYGDRGIYVCDRWLLGEDGDHPFACFMSDMGPRPSKDHSVDRSDNDGPYSPDNCRWSLWKDQCRNMRKNVFIEYQGERMTMAEAIERSGTGMNSGLFLYRLRSGMSPEEALEKPVRETSLKGRKKS